MRIAQYSTVLVTLLFVACSSDQKTAHQKPDGPSIGHWEKLPDGPESITDANTVLAGTSYISWGGIPSYPTPFVYDILGRSWRTGGGNGSPSLRLGASALWTNTEAVFWGGHDESTWQATSAPSGAYNLITDTWRLVSSTNEPSPREWTSPVWTGKEMIVWGGADTSNDPKNPPVLGDGSAYDPLADSWRTISSENTPSPRHKIVAVWTGKEMLIWGGTADSNMPRDDSLARSWLSSGAAYDPSSDTWRAMSESGASSQGRPIVSAWTGKELLVWNSSKGEGAAYNPATNNWRAMDGKGPLLQYGSCGLWTGRYFLVCGDHLEPLGELYDPEEDRWYLMESQLADNGPGPWGGAHGDAYNGDAYLLGGFYGGDLPLGDLSGYRYVIPSDTADAQP